MAGVRKSLQIDVIIEYLLKFGFERVSPQITQLSSIQIGALGNNLIFMRKFRITKLRFFSYWGPRYQLDFYLGELHKYT